MYGSLERHLDWLDAEFAEWEDTSENERVARTLSEIDCLSLQLRTANAEKRAWINAAVAALQASIEDFGF